MNNKVRRFYAARIYTAMSKSSKRGGLTGTVEANTTSAVKKGIEINILDELGITGRQTAFTQRTLALSDPAQYAKEREGRFTELTNRVAKTYEKVREELSKSGLPINEVLRLSSQAAKNVYDTENAILETQFPSGSNDAAMQAAEKKSFPGMIAQAAPRRAPAKRRATKKK
jgi:hypothetical protein